MTHDDNRGTGRTARQMLEAPKNAIFIWCNGILWYPRELAAKNGRTDLQIVSPDWLESGRWSGQKLTGIVVDHALELAPFHYDTLQLALTRIRP